MGMREDYQAIMEKRLNEWKAQTERFSAVAGEVEAQAKAQYEKDLSFLKAKQDDAWVNFNKLKTASEDVWGQFTANMDKAGEDLKEAAERMSTQYKR